MSELEQSMAQVDILPKKEQLLDPQETVVASLLPSSFPKTTLDSGYEDFSLYRAIDEDLSQCAHFIQQLEKYSSEGEAFVSILYSARSLSKAIPQLQSNDQENKAKLYEESIKILQPEVERMKNFLSFQEQATRVIFETVSYLTQKFVAEKRDLAIISPELFLSLAKLFGMLFTVDNLKNVKSAWSNDLSAYKRACSNLRRTDGLDIQSQQRLIFFLANNNAIINEMKKQLETIKGFKEVLVHLTHFCLDKFDNGIYFNAEEKHMYLKSIMFLVFAMDGIDHQAKEKDDKKSILRLKKLRLEHVLKTFKRYPVIPLFGDMHIDTSAIFRLAPHINNAKVEIADGEELSLTRKYEIAELMDTYTAEYEELSAELAHYKFMQKLLKQMRESKEETGDDTSYVLGNKALRILGGWTTAILEQAAWKYAHPTDEFYNKECKKDSTIYEKAVRYNYTLQEQKALIRLLTMVNDIHGQLQSLTNQLAEGINGYVHFQLQTVIHGVLQRLLSSIQKSKSMKKKKNKNEAPEVIAHLCNLISDLNVSVNIDPSEIMAMATKKQAKKAAKTASVADITMPKRKCAPTTSQLIYFRSVLNTLVGFDNEGKSALLKRKELSPQQFDAMKKVYDESAHYLTLLQFERTLKRATDLSSLWFKEYHLELEKKVQFPIEFSLPWMLMSTAMTSPDLHQHLLVPLELYNQAGACCLFSLKSQTLYDEVQAEVNTCFDQIVFKITQQVYISFKANAHVNLVPHDVKEKFKDLDIGPTDLSYKGVLSQRHLRLLGRTVDLHDIISASMNDFFRRTINMCISWFESKPLSYVIAFENMLDIERETHRNLSNLLNIIAFDDLFEEQNHSVNPASNNGRIESRIMLEVLYDLSPNYVFSGSTNEFTKAIRPVPNEMEREPVKQYDQALVYGSKALASVAQAIYKQTTKSVRVGHAVAILNLINAHKIPAIINELSSQVVLILHNVIRPFVGELVKGMPKQIKNPVFEYGINAIFQFYQLNLQPILAYPELRTEVFQEFASIGNVFCFIQLLEEAQELIADGNFIITSPFGQLPPQARRVAAPSLEEAQRMRKDIGIAVSGGYTHPVTISKIAPNSIASDMGLQVGDEILAFNNIPFKQPGGNAFVNLEKAKSFLSNIYGQSIVVKGTSPVSFTSFVHNEIEMLSQSRGVAFGNRTRASARLSDNAAQGSILKGALQRVDSLVDQTSLKSEWGGVVNETDVYSSAPEVFHRLWSAINFSLLITKDKDQFTVERMFGDGLHWGGLTVVYILGQSFAFELFDYVNYWLSVVATQEFVISEEETKVGDLDLNQAARRGVEIQRRNRAILNLLRTHFPDPDARNGDATGVAHPPFDSTQNGVYISCAREKGEAGVKEVEV
eukprot:m.40491 g.40491  ORF g.40491 m.40491 type:complete len:1374 (+) comp10358_c0_seq1:113-4234(+)